jgi:hypothetical protein
VVIVYVIRQLSASPILRLLVFFCGMEQMECYHVFFAGDMQKIVSIINIFFVIDIEMTRLDCLFLWIPKTLLEYCTVLPS